MAEAEVLLAQYRDDPDTLRALEQAAALIIACFQNRGRVLACGNGGSMADAMHFCEEWTGRFRQDRAPYPAIALCDPTHLTCVANDYGFDHVFSRQVEAYGHQGDVLFVLTTSGQSNNLLLAAEAARARGMSVVGMVGRGGGALAEMCDVVVNAPGATSDRIQELQMMSLHILIEAVEIELQGNGATTD